MGYVSKMCAACQIYQMGYQVPVERWDKDSLKRFEDALKMAEDIDRENGVPDCVDSRKAEWAKAIKERLG